jgi:hypothetical protein
LKIGRSQFHLSNLRTGVLILTLAFSLVSENSTAVEMGKPRIRKIVPIIIIPAVLVAGSLWISRRSGVTSADLKRKLPGDSIVVHSNWTIDRAAVLNAPIDKVWPWIEQLGKGRAGWYAPSWMEKTFNSHALDSIDSKYQHVKPGDILDDWGPGVQEVVQIQKPNILLVKCLRKPDLKKGETKPTRPMEITILTMLEPIDSTHTRIIFRWRSHIAWYYYPLVRPLGGTFDYTFFKVMVSGLNQRLAKQPHSPHQ